MLYRYRKHLLYVALTSLVILQLILLETLLPRPCRITFHITNWLLLPPGVGALPNSFREWEIDRLRHSVLTGFAVIVPTLSLFAANCYMTAKVWYVMRRDY